MLVRLAQSVLALGLIMALAAPLRAQTIATLRPLPAALEMAPGAEGTLEIVLENAQDVYGIDVRATFDPALVELVDADAERAGVQMTAGSFPQPDFVAINTADNTTGTLRYVATQVNPTPPASGSGVVLSLRLRARAAGEVTIAITSVEMADRDGFLLAVTPGAATIMIESGPPTATGIPLRPNDTPAAEAPPAGSATEPAPTTAAPAGTQTAATIENSTAAQPLPTNAPLATSDSAPPPAAPTAESAAQLTEPLPGAATSAPPQATAIAAANESAAAEPDEPVITQPTAAPAVALGEANSTGSSGPRTVIGQDSGLTAGQPALAGTDSPNSVLPVGLIVLVVVGVGAAVWLVWRRRS
jgi:hypothetical protein